MKDLLIKKRKTIGFTGGCNNPLPQLTDTEIINIKLDEQFNRDGRRWRVSAIGIGFIIGTDIKIAPGGAVQSHNDIINVKATTATRPLS